MKKDQQTLLIAAGVGAALLFLLKSKNDEKNATARVYTDAEKAAVQAKRRTF